MTTRIEEIRRKVENLAAQKAVIAERLRAQEWKPDVNRHDRIKIQLPSGGSFELRDGYGLHHFVNLHNEDLVVAAYHSLLGRKPDEEGRKFYTSALRSGAMDKPGFLFRLRQSKEGRKRGVRISGLWARGALRVVYRIPVIGYLMRLAVAIFTLPVLIRNFRVLENAVRIEADERRRQSETRFENVESALESIGRRITEAESRFETRLEARLGPVNRYVNDLEKKNPLHLDVPEFFEAAMPLYVQNTEVDRGLGTDCHYLALENAFYETAPVRKKQAVYVGYLKDVAGQANKVLDVGCGRGEFLEILKGAGVPAEGIEINAHEVESLRERGFVVHLADGLGFLESDKRQWGAITLFQVIEHLDSGYMNEFLSVARERLVDGGVLILETVNPHSSFGFSSFYMDPTHVKPVPPEFIAFQLQYLGFTNVKVLYSMPLPPEYRVKETKRNYHDYAVIAQMAKRDT